MYGVKRKKTHLVTKIEFGRGVISSSRSKSWPGASAGVSTCPPTVSSTCTDGLLSIGAEGTGNWAIVVSDVGSGGARLKAGIGGIGIEGDDVGRGNDAIADTGGAAGAGAVVVIAVVVVGVAIFTGSGLGLGLSKAAFLLEGSASPLCHGPATTLAGFSASPAPILTYCSGNALSFRRLVYEFPAATTAILWVRTYPSTLESRGIQTRVMWAYKNSVQISRQRWSNRNASWWEDVSIATMAAWESQKMTSSLLIGVPFRIDWCKSS